MAFCTGCGEQVSEGHDFCQKCGTATAATAAAQVNHQTPPPPPASRPTNSNARSVSGNAACPNCGGFSRVRKSALSTVGKFIIAAGLLPAVIGGYQIISFQNKSVLEQEIIRMNMVDPSGGSAVLVGFGIFIMVIGVLFAGGGNLVGAKVCEACGYKFKRGE